ncbi:hypothetical protein Tco_0976441 [Tanacetum coccineum]|uniref:Uncharacterized protein n=1 Tax=Tanacetum coccineum TaxID=301880 RepID=A0ABQ5EH87_9ASTR
MESRVDALMKDAISIIGRSENVFRISSDMMRQLPPKPLRQEAFEDLVMNFILNQEEKVKQLEEYMGVIGSDFMQLSSEVIGKLKEEIKMKENRVKKIKKIMRPSTIRKISGTLPSNTVKNPKLSTSSVLSARSYPIEDPQCLTHVFGSVNTITIHPKQQNDSHDNMAEEEKQEREGDPEDTNTIAYIEERRDTLLL